MKRKIEMIIKDTCQGCPYCRFVDHPLGASLGKKIFGLYGPFPEDPTYDCFHPNVGVSFGYLSVTIADRWDIGHPNNDKPKGWPKILETCPLPIVE